MFICKNTGDMGSTLANATNPDYKNKIGTSHAGSHYHGYGGASVRGVSLATSKNVWLEGCSCKKLESSFGFVHGFDCHLNSRNILISNCEVLSASAGKDADMNEYNNNPSLLPVSVGFKVQRQAKDVTLQNVHVADGSSPIAVYEKLIEE